MIERTSRATDLPKAAALAAVLLVALSLYPSAAPAVFDVGDSIDKVKLTDGRGKAAGFPIGEKVLVVAFWHPGCEPCVDELKELSKHLKGEGGRGVEVVAVTRGKDDGEKKEAEEALSKTDKKFVSFYDPDISVSASFFNVREKKLPQFFLVDKSGRLRTSGISTAAAPIRNLSFMDFIDIVKEGKPFPLMELVPNPNPKKYPGVALVGRPAPELPPMKDLRGKLHSTEKYRGAKNLMVVFWSTRCPHCKREMPRLQSFYISYAREFGVELLAYTYVPNEKSAEETRKYVKENQITFPVIPVGEAKLLDDFKVKGVPCVFIVSREGKVAEFISGARGDVEQVLVSVFQTYPELELPKKEKEE